MTNDDETRSSTASTMSSINITPLIDVMLVLLIIFMIVIPVVQLKLDVPLPLPSPPDNQGPVRPTPLVMVLEIGPGVGLVIRLNQHPVSGLDDLAARLRDLFQGRSDKTLFVKASGTVPYGRVVEAMDVARGAGAERLGILSDATRPPR